MFYKALDEHLLVGEMLQVGAWSVKAVAESQETYVVTFVEASEPKSGARKLISLLHHFYPLCECFASLSFQISGFDHVVAHLQRDFLFPTPCAFEWIIVSKVPIDLAPLSESVVAAANRDTDLGQR